MFDDSIFLDLISVSMVSSIISTQIIQKIKETLSLGKLFNKIASLIISFGTGFIYSQSFYNKNIILSIWIALFTIIGSEKFYQAINGKLGNKKIRKL